MGDYFLLLGWKWLLNDMEKIKLKLGERVRLVKPDFHTVRCHGVAVGDCGVVVVEERTREVEGSRSVRSIYAYVVFDRFKGEGFVGGEIGGKGYDYSEGIPIDSDEVEVIMGECAWQVRMIGGVGVEFPVYGEDEVSVMRKALRELGWEVVRV